MLTLESEENNQSWEMPQHLCLGIESSCDDSAAGIVAYEDGAARILSSVVFDQNMLHAEFGGIVPEIAARAHAEKLDFAVEQAFQDAECGLSDIDLIAVTSGPGLIGGVMAGVMLARGLALGSGKALVGVNHLAGHALSPRMCARFDFPYLLLLVSGGHCQFLLVKDVDDFTRIGGTIDDSPGEAFDKVARILGLGQPGGPAIEAIAATGDGARFPFPRPLLNRTGCDLSFSGLKTAVLRTRDEVVSMYSGLPKTAQADLAASFQSAVIDVLVEKTKRALAQAEALVQHSLPLAVAGGVAANQAIRAALAQLSSEIYVPPMKYCTDNAAMIAWAGLERQAAGLGEEADLTPRPRWPLDMKSRPLIGSGKKGAKA